MTDLSTEVSKAIDSREVATMMGKEHKQLLREIRDISGVLKKEGENFSPSDYFIKGSYTLEGNKKEYVKYDCTKMGCELSGNKLQGKKGILFTAAYVKRFNEMEVSLTVEAPVSSYMITDPIKRAEAWIEEEKERQALKATVETHEETIKELEPKARFADAVADADNCILIRELARTLKQNNVNIGERRLFDFLKKKGLLVRDVESSDHNLPTQKAMELGLFRIKTTTIGTSKNTKVNKTTKVTPEGQRYIINKFLSGKWVI
jgi:Rha family phage regulatory protein